jgi:hypothetical protein
MSLWLVEKSYRATKPGAWSWWGVSCGAGAPLGAAPAARGGPMRVRHRRRPSQVPRARAGQRLWEARVKQRGSVAGRTAARLRGPVNRPRFRPRTGRWMLLVSAGFQTGVVASDSELSVAGQVAGEPWRAVQHRHRRPQHRRRGGRLLRPGRGPRQAGIDAPARRQQGAASAAFAATPPTCRSARVPERCRPLDRDGRPGFSGVRTRTLPAARRIAPVRRAFAWPSRAGARAPREAACGSFRRPRTACWITWPARS